MHYQECANTAARISDNHVSFVMDALQSVHPAIVQTIVFAMRHIAYAFTGTRSATS
jgi:hypothetical protein